MLTSGAGKADKGEEFHSTRWPRWLSLYCRGLGLRLDRSKDAMSRAALESDGELTHHAEGVRAGLQEIILRPRKGWVAIDWRELYQQRELLYFLVMRDVKVRYKQTVLGVGWAVLQPIFMMSIFTLFFSMMAGIRPDAGIPYPVFAYAALLPWTFFSNTVTLAGLSLVNHQALLTKVYLPRIFVPAAHVGGGLLDLAISFCVFIALMLMFGRMPGSGVVMLPVLIVLTIAAALGAGLTLAALTVSYRDFRYLQQFLLQSWLFLSPVIYPLSLVPERFRELWALNPLTGIIEGYRSAFFGTPWDWSALGISAAVTSAMLLFGLYYFRKTERRFADIA
jgi:lipopolysaccharide transport system permease protein